MPEEAEVVRELFESAIRGESMLALSRRTGLRLDAVKRVLERRVYAGEIRSTRGEWIPSKSPPIVPLPVFLRAREAVDARRYAPVRPRLDPNVRTATWILRDVATCARCGARMGAAYGKDHERDHYYRCVAKCQARGARVTTGSYVRVRDVEDAAEPLILERLKELREEIARGPEPTKRAAKATDFAGALERLAKKRARHLETFADGLMEKQELRAALARIETERAKVEQAQADAAKVEPLSDPAVRRALLASVENIETAWRRSAKKRILRRGLVKLLVARASIEKGQPPRIEWRTLSELGAPFGRM